jgi:heme exporter protein C
MENSKLLRILSTLSLPLTIIAGVLVFAALRAAFMVVPDEKVMGAVQRIFYFHVASAIACYVAFAMVLIASLFYLATRAQIFDIVNDAAAEVGFVFCTITLASGMIWGHSAWNTWFRWEPRLVTFLLLWLIFLAFLILRHTSELTVRATHSAVLGIVGACVVPLVWVSVKFLPQTAQLHPQVIENRGLKDPLYYYGLNCAIWALVMLQFLLVSIRIRLGIIRDNFRMSRT